MNNTVCVIKLFLQCLQEVFGDRPLLWFFPVQTTIGDGLTFPTRINTTNIEANYQSTSSRPPLAEAMASPAAKAVRGIT